MVTRRASKTVKKISYVYKLKIIFKCYKSNFKNFRKSNSHLIKDGLVCFYNKSYAICLVIKLNKLLHYWWIDVFEYFIVSEAKIKSFLNKIYNFNRYYNSKIMVACRAAKASSYDYKFKIMFYIFKINFLNLESIMDIFRRKLNHMCLVFSEVKNDKLLCW